MNTKKTNVILSDKNILLYGKEYIQDMIENLTFNIYPNSFYQVNSIQMEKMYKRALDYANLQGTETVYDLYCGIGTITLLLSQKCKTVYGIEVVAQAIESAKQNAKINNIENAKFICGKVEDEIENLVAKSNMPNVIVLDPARKGCEEKVLDTILNVKPEKIIYISCNPSTLARDLKKLLSTKEYELQEVTPYDLFSHTMHVETVALLSKLNVDKHIDVEIKLDELDLTSAESKATYAKIKEYILEKFGLKVPTLYIAQIKKKCGIELRENYNKSKKEKQVIPQCTPEKEEAIMDALRHFKMI